MALSAGYSALDISVAGPHPADASGTFEVAGSSPRDGAAVDGPVTGFNASLGWWLLATGRASAPYVARQGTALGRIGRVHVTQNAEGAVCVGGGTVTCVAGTVEL